MFRLIIKTLDRIFWQKKLPASSFLLPASQVYVNLPQQFTFHLIKLILNFIQAKIPNASLVGVF